MYNSTKMLIIGLFFTLAAACTSTDRPWHNFESSDMHSFLRPGQPTLVQVTADWCATCVLNEKQVLNSQEAMSLYNNLDVRLVRADLTEKNQEISDWLTQYKLNSNLPIYLFFTAENEDGTRTVLMHEDASVISLDDLQGLLQI